MAKCRFTFLNSNFVMNKNAKSSLVHVLLFDGHD